MQFKEEGNCKDLLGGFSGVVAGLSVVRRSSSCVVSWGHVVARCCVGGRRVWGSRCVVNWGFSCVVSRSRIVPDIIEFLE